MRSVGETIVIDVGKAKDWQLAMVAPGDWRDCHTDPIFARPGARLCYMRLF
jgi:hypothetical protein